MTTTNSIQAEAKEYAENSLRSVDANPQLLKEVLVEIVKHSYIAGATNRPVEPINTEGLKAEFDKLFFLNQFSDYNRQSGNAFVSSEKIFSFYLPHLRSNVETTTEGWVRVETKKSVYYKPVVCESKNGNHAVCWRANDGENDIYTINQTDIIFENVVKWSPLPPKI